jgi:hypothetical protein
MTRFEFLYLVISLITTLIATDTARSWGALLRRRVAVQFYWIHIAWSVLILFVLIQNWWTFWQYRFVQDWPFLAMAALIGNFLLLAIMVSIITPARQFGERLDLEKFFYEVSPVFFTLIAVLMVTLALVKFFIAGQPLASAENVIRAVAISIAMLGAMTRSVRVHTALVGTGSVLLTSFVFLQVVR